MNSEIRYGPKLILMLRHTLLVLQLASAFVSDLNGASFVVGIDFSVGLFVGVGGKVSRPLFRRDINTLPGNETLLSTSIEKPTDRKDIKKLVGTLLL